MARWYEGAEEAAFKPVGGGYVFQPPTLSWPLTRAPAYLVNEAQKAELAACLRRQRVQTILVMMVVMLVGLGLGVLIAATGAALRISTVEFIAVFVMTLLAVIAIAFLPYFFAVRAMRPLLAGAPRTEERIATGERLQRIAQTVSPKLLWLGGAGGIMMIVGNLMTIADEISGGRAVFVFPWQIFGLVVGALLTSYFVYLGILRKRSKVGAN
ncbi:MAG TPA: hypothetical protein VIY51_24935 [Xanthobacteraceae bacterium]